MYFDWYNPITSCCVLQATVLYETAFLLHSVTGPDSSRKWGGCFGANPSAAGRDSALVSGSDVQLAGLRRKTSLLHDPSGFNRFSNWWGLLQLVCLEMFRYYVYIWLHVLALRLILTTGWPGYLFFKVYTYFSEIYLNILEYVYFLKIYLLLPVLIMIKKQHLSSPVNTYISVFN